MNTHHHQREQVAVHIRSVNLLIVRKAADDRLVSTWSPFVGLSSALESPCCAATQLQSQDQALALVSLSILTVLQVNHVDGAASADRQCPVDLTVLGQPFHLVKLCLSYHLLV